jgi:hypothetical protein
MKKFDFNVPIHRGDGFIWKDNVGISKVGIIEPSFFDKPFTNCYKDDLQAKGCIVESHKTGKKKEFILTNTVKDSEGKDMYWVLEDREKLTKIVIFREKV